MISTQRIVSAVVIGIVCVLPLVASLAVEAEASIPVASPKAQETPKAAKSEPVSVEVLAPEHPVVQTTATVLITAEAPKAKQYVCGNWQDSAVGGQFKRCEWM